MKEYMANKAIVEGLIFGVSLIVFTLFWIIYDIIKGRRYNNKRFKTPKQSITNKKETL